MRESIHRLCDALNARIDSAFTTIGFAKLCLLLVLSAVALAIFFSNTFFFILTGSAPHYTNIVAALSAFVTGFPIIIIFLSAYWRSNQSRYAIHERAQMLDEHNAALARAEESLRQANETLEARVRERTADLNRARLEAEEASAAKSQFLANMSHELRTPLNAIIGFSDMLIQRRAIFGDMSVGRVDEYSETINNAGQHLLSLVNDLLDLARIECGQSDLSPEQLCVETLTYEAASFLRHQATLRKQTIKTDIAAPSHCFEGDARAMHQILVNLLSNALKFSPEGSVVELGVSADSSGTTFTITDWGIGMSVQESNAALMPFSRLSEAHIAAGESIGLGLSITDALVTMHGGTLSFESEKGVGTTARVHIPTELGKAADPAVLVA